MPKDFSCGFYFGWDLEGYLDVFRSNLPIALLCKIGIGRFLIEFRSKGVGQ